MKARGFTRVLAALLILGTAPQLAAQLLTNRSFDLVLQGDDPGELFRFDLPFDPLVPCRVAFDGFFENLDGTGTGVSYNLSWFNADRSIFGSVGSGGFVPLAGFERLPVSFDQTIEFTPDEAFFHIEGGGPSDHFRFVGELAIRQVPEPGAAALLGAAVLFLYRVLRLSRHCRNNEQDKE